MKAAVFYGRENVCIEERPIPKAKSGQIVVKIDYAGLCGTDVDAYKTGSFLKTGMVLGHENVGTVSEIGEGVKGFSIGDKIICGPPNFCKEHCRPCRTGNTSICLNALNNTRGIGGPDGGYAEYMLVEDVERTILAKIPDNVDEKDAVLYDVICVAVHAIRLSRFRFGDNVVVSGGGGPVGLATVRLLKAAGAKKIVVLQTGPLKVAKLMEFGADLCIDPTETEDFASKIIEFFDNGVDGADVSFECAGTKASLFNCLQYSTRSGGQVMMVGQVTEPADNIIPSDFFVREIDLQPSFVFTAEDVEIYLKMLCDGKVNFPGMVTSIIPLGKCVEQGLALSREARRPNIKILINPSL